MASGSMKATIRTPTAIPHAIAHRKQKGRKHPAGFSGLDEALKPAGTPTLV
jgi:hypothetical protein